MSESLEERHSSAADYANADSGSPSRVRVLRAITRLNVGGPTRHVGLLMAGLNPKRFDQELVCGITPPSEGPSALGVPGKHHVVEALQRAPHPSRDLGAFRELRRLIRAKRPQIVHTHQGKAGALGRLAAHREAVPHIVHTCHGHTFDHYFSAIKGRIVRVMERMAAKRTHALIVQSPLQAQELQAHFGSLARGKVVLIPPALPSDLLSRLEPAEELRDLSRKELGLETEDWVVLLPARLVNIKRPLRAIRLAYELRNRMPKVRLLIAGDGDLRVEVEREIERLGLRGVVRLLGYASDMPKLYAASDLVILTSANEGTPLCLYEAMAAGTAVAATEVGGVADVLMGAGCLLSHHANEGEWARKIAEWWRSESRLRQGQRARQRVLAEQDPARLVGQVEALYEDLLTNGRPSQPLS